jgi:hypothetical protein
MGEWSGGVVEWWGDGVMGVDFFQQVEVFE